MHSIQQLWYILLSFGTVEHLYMSVAVCVHACYGAHSVPWSPHQGKVGCRWDEGWVIVEKKRCLCSVCVCMYVSSHRNPSIVIHQGTISTVRSRLGHWGWCSWEDGSCCGGRVGAPCSSNPPPHLLPRSQLYFGDRTLKHLPEPCYNDERPLVGRSPAQPGPGCGKTAAPPQQGWNLLVVLLDCGYAGWVRQACIHAELR